ncbi:MAG: hemerythrin [Burkholderiales bacterium]|jgi:hemerythrin
MQDQSTFEWNDGFKLGYTPMDETHQEFVEIVNAMLVCPPEDLLKHLDAFAVHGDSHFAQELAWMRETNFPSTDCHAGEHDAVMKSVREVRELLANGGDPAIARGLAEELERWFPGHTDYLDSALAQWMVKKKAGGVPVVIRRNQTFKPVPGYQGTEVGD